MIARAFFIMMLRRSSQAQSPQVRSSFLAAGGTQARDQLAITDKCTASVQGVQGQDMQRRDVLDGDLKHTQVGLHDGNGRETCLSVGFHRWTFDGRA